MEPMRDEGLSYQTWHSFNCVKSIFKLIDDVIPRKKSKPSIFDASCIERPSLGKGKGGYEIPLLIHDVVNSNSRLFSNQTPAGILKIPCSKSAYFAHDVYHHKMALIPDLVVNKCFAMVALIISNENTIHQGKVLLQPKCVNENLDDQMNNLFSTLNAVSFF